MIFFLGNGICGTYIYYNEDGEIVQYLPKQKTKKAATKKNTATGYVAPPPAEQAPPGEKPYTPKYKLKKKESSWSVKK
jgi:hypothetical protein